MNKKIKFAVVGLGHIGKRHVEMICKNKEAELSALVDIDPNIFLDFEHLNIPLFTSLQDFLESNIDTDVVNIATPNGLHAIQGIACLNKGFHAVIEKPLSLTKMDAEKLINTAIHAKKLLFTVKQNRYSPVSIWLKKIIEEKILKRIFLVQINCFWNRDESYYHPASWHGNKKMDGGTLFTQFSHFIDMLYWVFGDVENIKSKFYNFTHTNLIEFEDSGIISFDFINGGVGSFNYTTAVFEKNMECSINIIAENGTIKLSGQYMNSIEYCHIKNYELPEMPTVNNADNHSYVIQNVIDVLNENASFPNMTEDLKVVDIIERMYNANAN